MPSLDQYRARILKDEGSLLGVHDLTVDLNPTVTDPDAARSIISAALYDSEKLSGAYADQYVWVPRWSDDRRIESHGYRVRYVSVIEPPTSGTYKIQAFGYGETRDLPSSSRASVVQAAILDIASDELAGISVEDQDSPRGLLINLPFRLGLGTSAGRIVTQGAVGVALLNRDLTQPLKRGDRVLISPRIPFRAADQTGGLHGAINLALRDIIIPDMLPVVATQPRSSRLSTVPLSSIAPWLTYEDIVGYYAPTDWVSTTTFLPPSSGVYTISADAGLSYGTTPTPLSYNATGAEIEAALGTISGMGRVAVEPQGAASTYRIGWRTLHHEARLSFSAGVISDYVSQRLRDPYPISMPPHYQADFEGSSLLDPGYQEGHTWFVSVRRRAHQRICPQTYPRKSDGSLDTSKPPILGTQWVESTSGLENDLDQALPTVEKVAPAALHYASLSIANASPAGEEQRWLGWANKLATRTAAGLVYGPQIRRRQNTRRPWPPLEGDRGFFLPDS